MPIKSKKSPMYRSASETFSSFKNEVAFKGGKKRKRVSGFEPKNSLFGEIGRR